MRRSVGILLIAPAVPPSGTPWLVDEANDEGVIALTCYTVSAVATMERTVTIGDNEPRPSSLPTKDLGPARREARTRSS